MKAPRRTKADGDFPILLAVPNAEGMLDAWCPFCGRFHHHGRGEGRREAHCDDPASPFRQTGYLLKNGGAYLAKRLAEARKGVNE